jgi:two-component system NtrC family sensor kinase
MIQTNLDQPQAVVEVLNDPAQLPAQLATQSYRLLVTDVGLLDQIADSEGAWNGFSKLAVMLLAGAEERVRAVAYLRQGAVDYLLWPADPAELCLKIKRLYETQRLKAAKNSDKLGSSTDKLVLLHQATQAISQTWQFEEALKVVLTKARQLTGARISLLYLTDQSRHLDRQSLLISPPTPPDTSQDFWFHGAEQAALTQNPVRRWWDSETNWPDPGLKSALFMPIISREKLIGVLGLGHTGTPGFAASEIGWLSIFCDQVAIAIENARLFENLAAAYIDLAHSREKILQSRNTLQVLFDGIADGLCILDQKLTIMALNQVEAARQGYQPEDLVGKSYLSLDWVKAAPQLLERIKESLAAGRVTTWNSPENETAPYLKDREFRIYPIRDRIAQIEQVVVFGQDVAERRRWQASLFRSANLAAVGQLAGSVAHQINNPLTITMANSQLLLAELEPASDAYDLVNGILKAGMRIQNIVENLLGFSNQETYYFTEADLVETIEGALALVARSLQKDRIELVKQYQVQPKLSVSVSHLKLVWMNLLLNARDAVAGYTLQPRVIIATEAVSEREVKVAITDNGVGIAEKDFERLFRPFFTTKSVGKALGLGLYSAHAIVEHHGGQINVVSQPGRTTFEVTLPLDNPRDA